MENFKKMFDQGPATDIETSDDEEEYIEYIYKPRKYFLVALCNVKYKQFQKFIQEFLTNNFYFFINKNLQKFCKTDLCNISQLIECLKCHMTYYCSLEHMQNDAEHQQLCYALQQVADNSCGKYMSIHM